MGTRWGATTRRLACALLLVLQATAQAAAQPDTAVFVRDLDAALRSGVEPAVLRARLEAAPDAAVVAWLEREIRSATRCEDPFWERALAVVLESVPTRRAVELLARALAAAEPALHDCLLRSAYVDLTGAAAERFEVLVASVLASGILDAPDGLAADETFVRDVVDRLLARATPPTVRTDQPVLTPLEPRGDGLLLPSEEERPMSESR